MMRSIIFLLLLSGWACAQASPFIVSAPYPKDAKPVPTHCGFFMDAAAKQTTAVAKNAEGLVYCKLDIANLAAGSHTVTATHIVQGDPVFGNAESAKSAPLNFTKPSPAGAPTGLGLSKS